MERERLRGDGGGRQGERNGPEKEKKRTQIDRDGE